MYPCCKMQTERSSSEIYSNGCKNGKHIFKDLRSVSQDYNLFMKHYEQFKEPCINPHILKNNPPSPPISSEQKEETKDQINKLETKSLTSLVKHYISEKLNKSESEHASEITETDSLPDLTDDLTPLNTPNSTFKTCKTPKISLKAGPKPELKVIHEQISVDSSFSKNSKDSVGGSKAKLTEGYRAYERRFLKEEGTSGNRGRRFVPGWPLYCAEERAGVGKEGRNGV
ncbi:unnamed protein product [Moneuplotes crassus]|uniref:Uncharacterized protein n=1 Tax=Euplotes crassus TaxID=5936 RepID=A0AAD1TZT8_EUPCR|nr:unnamed protein product [Moneuplotes crassus]